MKNGESHQRARTPRSLRFAKPDRTLLAVLDLLFAAGVLALRTGS